MKDRIILAIAIFAMVFFLSIVPKTFSLGISPSEETVIIESNQPKVVQFFITVEPFVTSDQTIDVTSNVNWITLNPKNFVLGPDEGRTITASVSPLSIGNYTAIISASASMPGMRVSVTSRLNVISAQLTPGQQAAKNAANSSISAAQSAIIRTKGVNGTTTDAETMLSRAIEAYAQGNYTVASSYANTAKSLADNEYDRLTGGSFSPITLDPTTIIIIVVVIVLIILVVAIGLKRKPKPKEDVTEQPKMEKPTR